MPASIPSAFGRRKETELRDLEVLVLFMAHVYTSSIYIFNRELAPVRRACRPMDDPCYDCLVIGGGPAGLTAAIYLTRFPLSIKLVDAGKSRASLIPCTRNHAGYPNGISGAELVARMTEQAQKYGASIVAGRVTRLDRIE